MGRRVNKALLFLSLIGCRHYGKRVGIRFAWEIASAFYGRMWEEMP